MRQPRLRILSLVATTALLGLGMFVTPSARAGATIQVTTVEQGLGVAGCSLGEAILSANHDSATVPDPDGSGAEIITGCVAGGGSDVIELGGNVYQMASITDDAFDDMGPTATPVITSTIIIEGRGARIERIGSTRMRAFAVGPTGDLDLREVHVRDFAVRGGFGASGGGGGLGAGGALFVHGGRLRVQWSTFEANVATGGDGGYIGTVQGGGGGGLGGHGSGGSINGSGGGGGARGHGGSPLFGGGGGGGTLTDGDDNAGGFRCGGDGADGAAIVLVDGDDGACAGGGGGGGTDNALFSGDGGDGSFGGGGGGGAADDGDGGHGGFGGGGGAGAYIFIGTVTDVGGSGGDGGFGAGGGAGPGGLVLGGPGVGGTFGGDAGSRAAGGGAGLGGAIFGYGAVIVISDSTFSGNAAVRGNAGGAGGDNGADAGGAIFAVAGSTTIVNSTISGNESTGDGAGLTVYKPTTGESTSLSLSNSIVYGNTGRDECFVLNGVSVSGARNLIAEHASDARTPCPAVYLTSDPQLSGLALNAPGRTPTMALGSNSPAVDEALDTAAPLDDQRGVPRPQGDHSDIGAYELVTDATAPVASPTAAPAANGAGWNGTAVTVTWHWADEAGGSGIDPARCPASTTSTGEGAGIVVAATCYDLAGNAGSASRTVAVDLTAPSAAPTKAPAANDAGWNRSDVTVTWHWTDPAGGSGLDAGRCPASTTSSGEGEDLVVGATCYDRADNPGAGGATVDVDMTAPGVTCGPTPTYVLSGDHSTNVTATVSDVLSRPVAATLSADVTATDVAVAGPGSKSLTGEDRAGNQTTVACPYLVRYAFLGFQQPIPPGSVKAGSSIPVKFRLGDASGATLPDATAAAMATACLAQVTFDGAIQGCAAYDPVANTFQLDVKTAKSVGVGPHAVGIRIRVADGTVVNTDQVTVQVKK
jgi:hypothetical protein